MRKAMDFAKYFIKNGYDTSPNTYDGNMKLQKLLTFANAISIAEYGRALFEDDILAFTNGCVVENVRLRYKNDYKGFKLDSDMFQPDFTEQEYKVANLTAGIFGKETAVVLSNINHEFRFWKEPYQKGTVENGYHDKEKSVVKMSDYPDDIKTIKQIVDIYKQNQCSSSRSELINGITFYYEGFELDDNIILNLADFALSDEAEDDVYTVCLDDSGELVIY